jgi:hypothetical protein
MGVASVDDFVEEGIVLETAGEPFPPWVLRYLLDRF